MKTLMSVLLVFLINPSFAQQGADFTGIDGRVQSIESNSLDTLAQQLTTPYTTDLQKVRSIFRWITEHIAYKVSTYAGIRRINITKSPHEADSALKTLDERVAQSVVRNGEAVCDGYARLFKTLCSYAGIQAELITGYARTNMGRNRFRSNHTWNAVFIDSTWHLLDVTWASGFINYRDEYVKAYDNFYFLTAPEDFIREHYPEDLRWALLAHPPTLQEFHNAPFTSKAFVTSRILSFQPSKGIIEAAVGDSIKVELETDDNFKITTAADTLRADSSTTLAGSLAFIRPSAVQKGNKVIYTYSVTSPEVEWLNIVYNDEVVLRYKLNIRKEKPEENQQQFNTALMMAQ